MSVSDSAELLFKTRVEGAAAVDQLANSVRNVSAASTLASDGYRSAGKTTLRN